MEAGQLPSLADRLKALNPEVDAAALSNLTGHPMNAVIWLGNCTASFVSPQGLVITNHHCAYGSIQHNATEESNLLEEGFLAASRSQELPAAPGSRVLVTVAVEDVTRSVLAGGSRGSRRAGTVSGHRRQAEGPGCRVRARPGASMPGCRLLRRAGV